MIRFLDYDALLFMNFISVTFWKCAFHFEYSINKSFLWLAKCEWYRHTKFHHVTSHTTHGTREPDGRPCYYSHTDTTQPVQIHFLCRQSAVSGQAGGRTCCSCQNNFYYVSWTLILSTVPPHWALIGQHFCSQPIGAQPWPHHLVKCRKCWLVDEKGLFSLRLLGAD